MIGTYIDDANKALSKAKKWLQGNTRPHVLIGRTRKGFSLIDPRDKKQYYCLIVGKVYRKLS